MFGEVVDLLESLIGAAIFWRAATKAAATLRVAAVLIGDVLLADVWAGDVWAGDTDALDATGSVFFIFSADVLRADAGVVFAAAFKGVAFAVLLSVGSCVADALAVIFFSSIAVLGLAWVAGVFREVGEAADVTVSLGSIVLAETFVSVDDEFVV